MPKKTLIFIILLFSFLAISPLFAQESLELILTVPIERDSTEVTSVTPIGDFNADGYGDLLIGVQQMRRIWLYEAAYLYFGGPAFDSIPDLIFLSPPQSPACYSIPGNMETAFGRAACALGDFNGDGYDDFTISAMSLCSENWHDGRIYFYFGSPQSDTIPDMIFDGPNAWDHIGAEMASGDFNGDGFSDLLTFTSDRYYGQRVYIFLGGNPPDISPDWMMDYSGRMETIRELRSGFDVNADGYGDFGYGDLYPDSFWTRQVSLLFLGGDSLSHLPHDTIPGIMETPGDITGDGIDDLIGYFEDGFYLCPGGNPFVPEPTNLLWRYSSRALFLYRMGNGEQMLFKEDWQTSSYQLFNCAVPFDTIPVVSFPYEGYRLTTNLYVGDINADGTDDIAFTRQGWDHVDIYSIFTTGIGDKERSLPQKPEFLSAYPNPFNSRTTITVSGMTEAEIAIYDITGRRIALLLAKGGRAEWEAEDVPSGVYLARVVGEESGRALRLVVIR